MKLVTIGRFFQPAEAHLLRARLEAAGFHPRLLHEDAALSMDGYSMAVGGILVQVPENESDEVKRFLQSSDTPPKDPPAG